MKHMIIWLSFGLCYLGTGIFLDHRISDAEARKEYLLPGDVKEGWKVFNTKKCSECHSIWGEGGKGGPDLGSLPQFYVSQAQLAALMWNHGPEMWGRMVARKIPFLKIDQREMSDLFAFLYFIRYIDEPGDAQKGKILMETKGCIRCHPAKEGTKGDLSRWGMHINSILWAQLMWNHAPQMELEMKKRGVLPSEFRGNEMADLIAYIRTLNPSAEKVYLSPGDPQSGRATFTQKGCIRCHSPQGPLDLTKKREFPRTLTQLAGTMWNHSHEMTKEMEKKAMERPSLSSKEMADLVAYLFSIRYFDEPGNPERGKNIFANKQCVLCHSKGSKNDLSGLKGRISPIFMAQAMWEHGPEMLEKMRKAKIPWQRIDGKETVDLMEYLNGGML